MFLSVIILYLDLDGLLCAFPEKAVCQDSKTLESVISNKMWLSDKREMLLEFGQSGQ